MLSSSCSLRTSYFQEGEPKQVRVLRKHMPEISSQLFRPACWGSASIKYWWVSSDASVYSHWYTHCSYRLGQSVFAWIYETSAEYKKNNNNKSTLRWLAYLVTNLEVITELWAAAQFTVETLVDEAVEFIGAVAAVVIPVTQQSLVHAISIAAHEGRFVTSPHWNHVKMVC